MAQNLPIEKKDNMKKVLIVEDDEFLGSTLQARLEKAEYNAKFILDGTDIISTVRSYNPDLILLDLLMPIKDGFTLLEEIKKDADLKSVPVIIISNLSEQKDIDRAKKFGVKDYIIKSDLVLDSLVGKIDSYIK